VASVLEVRLRRARWAVPKGAQAMTAAIVLRPPLTEEQVRILRAIGEDRLTTNSYGRYVIEGEPRPDRKSREKLRGRGLIESWYEVGRGSHWRLTERGRKVLDGLA